MSETKMFLEIAMVSHLPSHSADGYSFGGGTILTIGIRSFFIGEEHGSHMLAEEIAARWNAERLKS
ncbi:MAG: hypothetical protein Q8L53_16885 [Aestuariivirga sp.]|nr:hypothetical protein [Aestuariivirga sp.]